jgi:hypothetical protein
MIAAARASRTGRRRPRGPARPVSSSSCSAVLGMMPASQGPGGEHRAHQNVTIIL